MPAPPDQSLRLEFPLSDSQFGSKSEFAAMLDLEARLEQVIIAAGVGELDGNEVGGGTFVVFTYGPEAEALFRAVAPTLLASPYSPACTVVLRHGPPGTAESRLAFPEAVQRFKVGP